jgi:aryl-alcohol dehydrogenase-like predicted oxidoreductase
VKLRALGKSGLTVSAVGFGAWATGGDWGSVDHEQRALHAVADVGVTFFYMALYSLPTDATTSPR